MPLLVHCPNQCRIRVPASRVGRVVRCYGCQQPLMIPLIESTLLDSGNWVECRAVRAVKKPTAIGSNEESFETQLIDCDSQTTGSPESNVCEMELGDRSGQVAADTHANVSVDPQAETTCPSFAPVAPTVQSPLLRARPWRTVERLTEVDPETPETNLALNLGLDNSGAVSKANGVSATPKMVTMASHRDSRTPPVKQSRSYQVGVAVIVIVAVCFLIYMLSR